MDEQTSCIFSDFGGALNLGLASFFMLLLLKKWAGGGRRSGALSIISVLTFFIGLT